MTSRAIGPGPGAGWRAGIGVRRVAPGTLVLLAFAALVTLRLGAPELAAIEGRWALICREMSISGDLLHPHLFGAAYPDKPPLSYWLVLAVARVAGGLGAWSLRVPSAVAGLVVVAGVIRLGRLRFDATTGVRAGWLLATSVLFVQWSRTAGADLLNVAAIVVAVTWYFERRDNVRLRDEIVFAVILAVGCLLKGLVVVPVALLAIAPDVATGGRWRRLFRPRLAIAAAAGAGVFALPFVLSGDGFAAVWHESVGRYLAPFDHDDSPVVYLVALPLYFLPWTIWLPAVGWRAVRRWHGLSESSRWALAAAGLILAFFALSGSRRAYYLLPVLPFLALATADWFSEPARAVARWRPARVLVAVVLAGLVVHHGLLGPVAAGFRGMRSLRDEVRSVAEESAPWAQWEMAFCDTAPAVAYYLAPGAPGARYSVADRPALAARLQRHPRTIVVLRDRAVGACLAELPPGRWLRPAPSAPGWLAAWVPARPSVMVLVPDVSPPGSVGSAADQWCSHGIVPYLCLEPGTQWELDGPDRRVTIRVLPETRMVDGVEARVVEERETRRGELTEVSRDFWAISRRSDAVGYFGEEVDHYAGGRVIDHLGSWIAGRDGAKASVLLPGRPLPGLRLAREDAPGVADDQEEVLATDVRMRTPGGSFEGCLRVREWSVIEADRRIQLFAPGVGPVVDGDVRLTRFLRPRPLAAVRGR